MDFPPQLVGVLAVFALLGLTLWWLKKKGAIQVAGFLPARLTNRGTRGGEKLLQRVDGLQLTPTHSLALVRMADRAILIGLSPGGFYLVESSSWKALQPVADQKA